MARLLGPDFINLQVRNLAASQAFYTDILGLTLDPRFPPNGTVVTFDSTTIPFAIQQATPENMQSPRLGTGTTIWLDCDDVDALYARLQAANIPTFTEPTDGLFGRFFAFSDPDGYRITVNKNPWDRIPLGGRS
jgi:predicted enzyme related to lactoylglutathione lyase